MINSWNWLINLQTCSAHDRASLIPAILTHRKVSHSLNFTGSLFIADKCNNILYIVSRQTTNKFISWHTLTLLECQIRLTAFNPCSDVAISPLSDPGRLFVCVLPLIASLLLSNKHHDDSEWTFQWFNQTPLPAPIKLPLSSINFLKSENTVQNQNVN